jgi:hypothetical protein
VGRLLAPEVVVLAVVALFFILRAYVRGMQRRQLREARWRSVTHGLPDGGVAVQLECEGEPTLTVRELPADLPAEEFSTLLAEAESEADERAAALNASRRLG